jgi:FAD/FMN-containing dehydrogenase
MRLYGVGVVTPLKNRVTLSWGRAHSVDQCTDDAAALSRILRETNLSVLPYGLGRSYGDSCLNEGGMLLETKRMDHFIGFDRATGILTCEAGVSLRDILLLCSVPNADGSYWFPPVLPGTKYVTVGGAIANDVHGKNHASHGTFGRHVLSFKLRRSDGLCVCCAPTQNADLFRATIGGLGLTGLIEESTLQLMRIPGLGMEVEDITINTLDEFFALTAESAGAWDYTVAWVDSLARGGDKGRGIFSRARHIAGNSRVDHLSPRFSVPIVPPFGVVNKITSPLLNWVYRHKLGGGKKKKITSYPDFFFPLDPIGNWNRLYGKAGFYQYQCVIPAAHARETILSLLDQIAHSGQGSFLAVIKTFGAITSPGMLSFPLQGTTLAIDFPNRGSETRDLLDRLDSLTLAAGGRVYPAKDGHMSSSAFFRYYPKAKDFSPFIDPRFSSGLWRRVTSSGRGNK